MIQARWKIVPVLAVLLLPLAVPTASQAGIPLPYAFLTIGGDQYNYDSNQWVEDNGVYTLDLSVDTDNYEFTGSVTTKLDPYGAYGFTATNLMDTSLDVLFGFASPIMTTTDPNTVYSSISGSLTDVSGDGDMLTPNYPGDPDGDGVVELQNTWFNNGSVSAGVDVGGAFSSPPESPPGHSDTYGPFESGPMAGPIGTFNELDMLMSFSLSDHDIATLNGFSSINAAPVPEPASVLLLGLGLAGAGVETLRRQRRRRATAAS